MGITIGIMGTIRTPNVLEISRVIVVGGTSAKRQIVRASSVVVNVIRMSLSHE